MSHKFDLKQSRQILSQGLQAHEKISNLKFFIYGLNSLASEIIKNLLLSNIGSLFIYEAPKKLTKSDLCSNFFLEESHKERKSCLKNLSELNPNTEITLIENENDINENLIQKIDCVIVCELFDREKIVKLNELCRMSNNKGFIYSFCLGFFSGIFLDYGPSFTVKSLFKKPNQGILKISDSAQEKSRFLYQKERGETFLNPGSNVQFSDRKFEKSFTFKIIDSDGESIKIDENDEQVTNFLNDLRENGGYYKEVLTNEIIEFQSFEELIKRIPQGKKIIKRFDNQSSLEANEMFILMLTFLEFFKNDQNQLKNDDYLKFMEILKKISMKYGVVFKESVILEKIFRFQNAQFLPFTSIFGSIIAQEALKCIGSHKPIHQFLFHQSYDFLGNTENEKKLNISEESRYSDITRIFGEDFLQLLRKERPIIVGSGALGCELLKNLTMIGVGFDNEIVLIDPDNIELSNLCRQFLFRESDIKKNKAETAAKMVKNFLPEAKITTYQNYLDKEKRDVFNDDFWRNSTALFSAVDNFNARKIINNASIKYEKPMFESATEGVTCNMEVIVPFKTSSYSNAGIPEIKTLESTSCTSKYFLTSNRDCISSALSLYKKYFTQFPVEINKIKEKMARNEEIFTVIDAELAALIHTLANPQMDKLIGLSLKIFYDAFYYKIKEDITLFPENHMKDGQKTWTFPRRFPHPIEFDFSKELHQSFLISSINLLQSLLFEEFNEITIKDISTIIPKLDSSNSLSFLSAFSSEIDSKKGIKELPSIKTITPKEFSKDEELDIEFVYSATNLTSSNYEIPLTDKEEVHQIAGNVIPAVITSTSLACGLVCMEYVKYLYCKGGTTYLRNSTCLMDSACYYQLDYLYDMRFLGESYYKPLGKLHIEEEESKRRSEWDKIVIEGPLLICDLIKSVEEKFQINLQRVFIDRKKVYDAEAFEEIEVPETDSIMYKIYLKEKKIRDAILKEMEETMKLHVEEVYENRIKEGNLLLKIKGTQKNGLKLKHFFYLMKKI